MQDRLLLLGRKVGMTQMFDANNCLLPVTLLEIKPCFVTQVKTLESNGYNSVQIAAEPKNAISRSISGHLKKANVEEKLSHFKEFTTDDVSSFVVGNKIEVSAFKEGEMVDVIATTKGRGFQGVMKRHDFAGGPASHGHMAHRRGGSFGMRARPGHILKNQKMPGHMGNVRRTVQNLVIVKVVPEKNILIVKGSVPGFNGTSIMVRKAKKA